MVQIGFCQKGIHADRVAAGAFYGFKTIIIPHNLPTERLSSYLRQAGADLLVAEAGAVDISIQCKENANLRNVVWVSREGGQHVDWSQTPDEVAGQVSVADWRQLVQSKKDSVGSELPASDPDLPLHPLTTVWTTGAAGQGTFVEYTQAVR